MTALRQILFIATLQSLCPITPDPVAAQTYGDGFEGISLHPDWKLSSESFGKIVPTSVQKHTGLRPVGELYPIHIRRG
jgi:hypothetical protein